MIFDKNARLLIDNMGWVDRGALWVYDVAKQKEKLIGIDGAKFLSLQAGEHGFFRMVHGESADRAISVRRIAEPEVEVTSVRYYDDEPVFGGKIEFWKSVDSAAVVPTEKDKQLLHIDAAHGQVTKLDLSWFTNANYDLGYQQLVGCLTLPGSHLVVVSVQRSSRLIVIDTRKNQPAAQIELADRGGNPVMRIRSASDFLADDYDTLCRVDLKTMSVVAKKELQAGSTHFARLFIGDYDLNADGTCVVARPYSGDVLLVDSERFEELSRAPADGQPLHACMVSETRVVTRDWKTGRVSETEFAI
jgi:hypothetical protein